MAVSDDNTPAPEIPADLPRVHRIGGPSDDKGGFNRRKVFSMAAMLAGLAGTVALPALATPKLSEAADLDVELLRLGLEFQALRAKALALGCEKQKLWALRGDRYQEETGNQIDAYADDELLKRLGEETGYSVTYEAWNLACDDAEALAKQIRKIPVRTMDGLVVKGKVLWVDLYEADDPRTEGLHWEAACVRDFLAEIDRLAINPVHGLQNKVASAFEASRSPQTAASPELVALFDRWHAGYKAWNSLPADQWEETADAFFEERVKPHEDKLVEFDSVSIPDLAIHARYLIEDGYLSYLGRERPNEAVLCWIVERLAEMAEVRS